MILNMDLLKIFLILLYDFSYSLSEEVANGLNKIKCYHGNKTVDNCYACYFTKITSIF
jgi:hypothetical protein